MVERSLRLSDCIVVSRQQDGVEWFTGEAADLCEPIDSLGDRTPANIDSTFLYMSPEAKAGSITLEGLQRAWPPRN